MALRELKTVPALVMIIFLLGLFGCARMGTAEDMEATPPRVDRTVEKYVPYDGSCIPYMDRLPEHYHEGFLKWRSDGYQFTFNRGLDVLGLKFDIPRLRSTAPTVGNLAYAGTPPRYGIYGDLSPDGTQFVYSACKSPNRGYEIAVVNLESGERLRLTANGYLDHYPVWSPDGRRIAFLSETEDYKRGLFSMAADGTDVQRVTPLGVRVALAPPVWSPDGERLAFVMKSAESDGLFLYTVRSDGSELTKIAETSYVIKPLSWKEFAPAVPAWSPDGRLLVFLGGRALVDGERSNRVNLDEEAVVYTAGADGADLRQVFVLKPYGPAPDDVVLAIVAGVFYPYFPKISQVLWSPDGKELLFFANGAHLINLDGSNLRRLSPPVLDGVAAWSPDGLRIAVYEMGNAESPQVIWTAEGHFRTLDHETDERVLLTVARDGSDLQTLLEGGPDSYFLPVVSPAEASVDLGVCAGGTVVSEPVANPGLVADCEALLQSRDMLSNTLNLKWNAETPLAEWEGVTLGGEPLRVHGLKLERMNGALPPELGQLSELRHLEIRGVGSKESRHIGFRLSGGIPAEIGNLQNLEVLDLSGNFLTGFIPAELSGLQRLETLWLEDNFLSGAIPPEMSALASLRYLNLGRNNLSGGVPAELGSLSQLQELHLWSNQLTGSIPAELGNLLQLERLHLSYNQLSGSIPPELSNLLQLRWLELSANGLSGCVGTELPDIWVEQSELERCA